MFKTILPWFTIELTITKLFFRPSTTFNSPSDPTNPIHPKSYRAFPSTPVNHCTRSLPSSFPSPPHPTLTLPLPNPTILELCSIWRNFVPFPSYQVFQRGGYYSVDVIPDSVAAISLNTMYFYDSNKGKVFILFLFPEVEISDVYCLKSFFLY